MNNIKIIKRILSYGGKDRYLFAVQIIASVVNAIAALYLPILFGQAIDHIIGAGNVDLEAVLGILIFAAVVAVVYGVSGWLQTASANRLSYTIVKAMRIDAVKSLMKTPVAYIDSAKTGDIVSRVIADADAVGEGLLLGFSQIFSGVLTITVTLVFMFRLDAGIAAAVVILTPLSLVAAAFIAGFSKKHFKRQAVIRGEQTALMDESVGNEKTVQAFGMEQEYIRRFGEINEKQRKASLKAMFYSSLTNPVTRFVNACVYAAVAFLGANLVVDGSLSVGELTVFLSYAGQYTKPFNEISGVVTELQNAIVCAGRVFEVIDTEPFPDRRVLLAGRADAGVLNEEGTGNVKFTNVDFSYSPDKPLIEKFNIDIKSGTRVAIVGPTGCGKTTLINLIMRFYDVNSGSIRIDGRDVRDYPLEMLHGSIGMVLQDVWIKNGTVRDNIAIGNADASDDEIREAARKVHADAFIERLPQKYDTLLGEGGVTLSIGEAQLICISRVMLSLPNILILDEATSSIDTRTEKYIQDSFAWLMRGRTSFVVAHRLSTIKNSDIIIVMRDGHIIEQGSHEALMSAGGFYKKLYESGV